MVHTANGVTFNDLIDAQMTLGDLRAAAEKGGTFTLRHPITDEDLTDAKGKPVTITVLGNDSREFRRKVDDIARARQRKKSQPTLAESDRMAAEMLASVTKAWSGIQWDGKTLDCTPENAEMLYRERTWVRAQVDEFVADAGNFLQVSATT